MADSGGSQQWSTVCRHWHRDGDSCECCILLSKMDRILFCASYGRNRLRLGAVCSRQWNVLARSLSLAILSLVTQLDERMIFIFIFEARVFRGGELFWLLGDRPSDVHWAVLINFGGLSCLFWGGRGGNPAYGMFVHRYLCCRRGWLPLPLRKNRLLVQTATLPSSLFYCWAEEDASRWSWGLRQGSGHYSSPLIPP